MPYSNIKKFFLRYGGSRGIKDAFGNVLVVGDIVVSRTSYQPCVSFTKDLVVGFTASRVLVYPYDCIEKALTADQTVIRRGSARMHNAVALLPQYHCSDVVKDWLNKTAETR